MLSMVARGAQSLSMRGIPAIASGAKQGSQRGCLWEGTNGFPESLAWQALEGVADAVEHHVMIEWVYPVPYSAGMAHIV